MQLISTHVKGIMEECKARAIEAGLRISKESLEYIVTNRDLVDLGPKVMVPTLYDYWVHDLEVIRGRGFYEARPHNPYETVINTRPPISFYNDNNPDWLNVMIFYHVIGHIDFFQNNLFFERTWHDDFCGKALSDKVLIDKIRLEKGKDKRYVDYVIECARSLDNLVGYYAELGQDSGCEKLVHQGWLGYFFNGFMRKTLHKSVSEPNKEIAEYNELIRVHGEKGAGEIFFESVKKRYPEFQKTYELYRKNYRPREKDIIEYILEESPVLMKPENSWMKEVISIIRDTSLYFQPQIRTRIANEGWASYWHQKLYLGHKSMSGNEVNYAVVNSTVMTVPKIGLNPYAIGYLLYEYLYKMAEQGRFDHVFQREEGAEFRKHYDGQTGQGSDFLFWVRQNCDDAALISLLPEKDFQDFTTKHGLFVVGKRFNQKTRKVQYYVKSRNGEDYRQMLLSSLYHPPYIRINRRGVKKGTLSLLHSFEGKQLESKYIRNVLFYLTFLWGNGPVELHTTELRLRKGVDRYAFTMDDYDESDFRPVKVVYTMSKGGSLAKKDA